ncbi:MAG: SGNH/GDSL hydrolase family protein [Phycisphaeraceae bacterium]|nr:MAG: SGNH/GDSL hydrolase family protein [Phycisphaeraceae bacterium]
MLNLGDSFGVGDTVNDGEEYAAILNEQFAEKFGPEHLPVLNAAIAGNGQGRWLKFLRRDAEQFRPQYIIMQVCRNDFCDNHRERLFRQTNGLEELPIQSPSIYRQVQEIVESIPVLPYSRIYAVAKQGVRQVFTNELEIRRELEADCPDRLDPETSSFDDLTIELLGECLRICRDRNWPVIGITAGVPEGARMDRLREVFHKYGSDIIYIPTKQEIPEMYNDPDDHWNAIGHLYVADILADYFSDQGLLVNSRQVGD